MTSISRRTYLHQTLGSLLTFSLLETLFATDAFGNEIKPLAARFIANLNAQTEQLRGKKLSQTEWQTAVEELMKQVDMADLLQYLDFDKLTQNLQYRERGERALRAKLPEVEGLPTELVFGHQIFALRKGHSVVPHGHNNMATAFLVLRGDFHGRHYDRLEDADDHMIIRPTIDRPFSVGQYSTISDHKDNVHWFTASSETAFLFNIHVLNVDPNITEGGRVYIDPAGEKLSQGRIKAPKLSAGEALKKYG